MLWWRSLCRLLHCDDRFTSFRSCSPSRPLSWRSFENRRCPCLRIRDRRCGRPIARTEKPTRFSTLRRRSLERPTRHRGLRTAQSQTRLSRLRLLRAGRNARRRSWYVRPVHKVAVDSRRLGQRVPFGSKRLSRWSRGNARRIQPHSWLVEQRLRVCRTPRPASESRCTAPGAAVVSGRRDNWSPSGSQSDLVTDKYPPWSPIRSAVKQTGRHVQAHHLVVDRCRYGREWFVVGQAQSETSGAQRP